MLFTRTENGNIIPVPEERQRFAYDLWATVRDQVLAGRTHMTKLIEGQRMTFELPSPAQILDFATIKESDEPETLVVGLQLPGRDVERRTSYMFSIGYEPPKH